MKKATLVGLALTLAVGVTACNFQKKGTEGTVTPPPAAPAVPAPEAAPAPGAEAPAPAPAPEAPTPPPAAPTNQ